MSDCEEIDFFWESLLANRKRKRDSKKDKKSVKHQNNKTTTTDESIKKKKKMSKFKEAMEGKKEKKKENKKKKNRLALELDGSTRQTKPTVKLERRSSDEPKPDGLTQDPKKKTKRKKKVAFDILPRRICVKQPKFVSSSQQCPKDSSLLEDGAVRDAESRSQVTVTHDNDSQCTSDDINSQDLFITQKTFRASPSQPSSGEACDKALSAALQGFPQRDKQAQTQLIRDGSHTCSQDSLSHQRHKQTNQRVQRPKTKLLARKAKRLNKAHGKPDPSLQAQMELNTDLTEEKTASRPVHVKPRGNNPYLDEPVVVNPSPEVTKAKKHLCTSRLQSPSCTHKPSVHPPTFMRSTSTQTENFFTTELSLSLSFCRNSRAAAHFEDLKPLDLSLTHRAREGLGGHLSAKTSSGEIKGCSSSEPTLHPCCSSDVTEVEVKKGPSGRHPRFTSTQVKCEVSPQSESDPKSADTTASSEDSVPPCRTGKMDLTQVRAVQMRLNESFFFKAKGEGQSPRSASPLMKLAQGRGVKSRKGH